ncbi:MAG: hypothetical protein V1776_01500 [Candidatus Diapherotrites archaeon]
MIESGTSTIAVDKALKHDLDSFKDHPRESYAQVIRKLVYIVKEKEDESKMELSEETLKKIEIGRKDIREGRVYTTEQLRKKLGI